jgi:hypothetical protein
LFPLLSLLFAFDGHAPTLWAGRKPASSVHLALLVSEIADAAVGIAIQRHFGGKRRVTNVELKIN